MKSYAHPIKDASGIVSGWCNEEEIEEQPEPSVDLKTLKFKNVGEFYQACLDNFKLSKTKVEAEIPEYDLSKADQREKAWQQIVAIYGQKP